MFLQELPHAVQEMVPAVAPAPAVPWGKAAMAWIEQPHVKWAVPIPLLLALTPLIWLFFRSTWRQLEEDALVYRKRLHDLGQVDYRPMVALALGAVSLTLQEYYGGRGTYDEIVRKWLTAREAAHPGGWVKLVRFDELYALTWWASTRIGGYLLPLVLWRAFFRKDSILDFGLRTRGFLEHAWIYAMFVAVMIPTMLIVARQPDFGTYYPFYKSSTRSWADFLTWEALYVGQFFALEIFFRGWWVRACRSFGAGAIMSMVVPYCMIHYGKPYLEACGAIVAGTVLGSLSMKTRSIYAGFLVHITVAILMDFLALHHRHALPTKLTPDGTREFVFKWTPHVLWIVWVFALLMLLIKLVHSWPKIRAWMQQRRGAAPA
ncbi:MAG: CPBP family intramembrane metalloprotease [Deltaproteobacteria bacterium]|nr:CPBP family intramembrane metalloprotease [Deltaproteobacteria bacterium]